jgi:hypothetical protein
VGKVAEVDEDTGRSGAQLLPLYHPQIRRHEQGWPYLVPISWLAEQVGTVYAGPRWRDFLSLDSVADIQTFDWSAELGQALEGCRPEFGCDLGTDWEFDLVVTRARKGAGHAFRGRRVKNLSEQLVRMAYDLETAVWLQHPALTTPAVAGFWTSWGVWHYLSVCAEKVAEEVGPQQPAAASPGSIRGAVTFIYRQFWSYAEEVRNWQPSPEREEDVHRRNIGCLNPKRRWTKREAHLLRVMHEHNIATAGELARCAKVDPTTAWRWLRGQNTPPGHRPSDARIRLLRLLDLQEADIPD